MKTLPFVLILAAALSACSTELAQTTTNPIPVGTAAAANKNLIVFYDPKTDPAPLLQAVNNIGASVLYRYQNFHALAIRLPENVSSETAAADLARIRGVLSVNQDSVAELH